MAVNVMSVVDECESSRIECEGMRRLDSEWGRLFILAEVGKRGDKGLWIG